MFAINGGYLFGSTAKDVLKTQTALALELVTGGKVLKTIEELVEAAFKVEAAYNKQYEVRKGFVEAERAKKGEEEQKKYVEQERQRTEERRLLEAEQWAEYQKKNPVRRWDQRDGNGVPTLTLLVADGNTAYDIVIPRGTKLFEVLTYAASSHFLGYNTRYDDTKYQVSQRFGTTGKFTSCTDQVHVLPWMQYRIFKRVPKEVKANAK